MQKRVTQIPATLNRFTSAPVHSVKKRKVAGYARVSTTYDEQQSSYEVQMDYYRTYITGRSDWEFVGMYSDEGISATSTKYREGFNKMISDALDGKIDLIITKSISRFARNTVDSLTTVRKLKDKGVEIYFEKENIWTLDSKGELLITIMSSLAQEESRSISENTTWGVRKSFADGKVRVSFSKFLGYDEGFVINEEEAKTVRLIYKLFITGYSPYGIAKELMARGLKSPSGKDRWHVNVVESILTNEKYKGDALLQKKYTVDFLRKKQKTNEGEIPQYYVEGHHEPIIDPAIFDFVQTEIKKQDSKGKRFNRGNILSAKIKCGDCGGRYGAKVWHSNDKYRRIVYTCNDKYKNECRCATPTITEDDIKGYFIKAINKLLDVKEETLENLELLTRTACDTEALENELQQLRTEVGEIENELQSLISRNARMAIDQEEYNEKYGTLYGRYEKELALLNEIDDEILDRNTRKIRIQKFTSNFMEIDDELTAFDPQLWGGLLEVMTVYREKKITVTFVGGIEVEVE